MSLRTAGTNANTSLAGLYCGPHVLGAGSGIISAANIALFNSTILDDKINGNPIFNGPSLQGMAAGLTAGAGGMLLYVPNRGVLNVLAGDYVLRDITTGWPILVSANAMTNGPWTHSGTAP